MFVGRFTLVSLLSCFCLCQAASNKSNHSDVCTERQNHVTNNKSPGIGFVFAVVAIVMFGSNFVPIKKFSTGDGVFFQWVLCIGIWITGLVVHLSFTEMNFYPLTMVGGAIWCTGNLCVVPIIKCIGLAMGLLIWGLLNLLSGWATGRFGTFGLICAQPVSNSVLNYIGVLLAMMSLVVFMFIKNEETTSDVDLTAREQINYPSNDQNDGDAKSADENSQLLPKTEDSSWFDHWSSNSKRALGILLSVVSGICYGISFVPMYIIQKRDRNAPNDGIEYVFSQFCGILLTSTFYFVVYCIYKGNKPDVYPSVIAPGLVSGVLWAIGCVSWFVANTELSEPISFPIVTTGPGIIASIWGILVFKEIKGLRNFLYLGLAFCFQISGAVITGSSK